MRGGGGRHGPKKDCQARCQQRAWIAPEAVAPRATEPVTREQLDRGRHCDRHLPSLLQPNRAGGVLTEQRALADVAAKHRRALVPCLFGDDALWNPSRSSRGRKACPQRVTGHLAGVEPGTGSVALQHERHRLTAESRCTDVAMAVHRAEGRSLGNA